MDCEQFLALISAKVDRSLREGERALLEIHLAECSSCSAALDDLSLQDRLLRLAFGARRRDAAAVAYRTKVQLAAQGGRKCSLLLVDDEPYILNLLATSLARMEQFEVLTASSAQSAQRVFAARPVDIILTDQKMPRRTGVQLLEWVRERHPGTVRLLMTGFAELEAAVEAINRGHVYYYLLKPWRPEELQQILRNAAEKFTLERKRERYMEELRHLNRDLERRVVERTRELEEANLLLQQRTRELERLALTDPLTGLFNRRATDELARFALKMHNRYPSPLALGFIDVDHFKNINTQYLLTGGDEVLKGLARILTSSLREVDSVGRVGGEEFLIIARETGEEGAKVLAERIRATVENTPIEYNGRVISITVSVGFAVADVGIPADYASMRDLAAGALSAAKQNGRNRCEIRRVPAAAAG
jgi:diguanylate cyclase (GGDEF)-like protein